MLADVIRLLTAKQPPARPVRVNSGLSASETGTAVSRRSRVIDRKVEDCKVLSLVDRRDSVFQMSLGDPVAIRALIGDANRLVENYPAFHRRDGEMHILGI